MRKKFPKRTFNNRNHFRREWRFVTRHVKALKEYARNGLVDIPFRERIMMAVTSVNHCRHCSFYHTRVGKKEGLDPSEIRALLSGEFDSAPDEQVPALLYCQHFAETGMNPEASERENLIDTYGHERAEAIETVARMISFGNLIGNSFDAFLYRISCGLLGGLRK